MDGWDAGGKFLQKRPGPDLHLHLVQSPGRQLVTEEKIGDHIQAFAQRQVLKDRGDPHLQRLRGGIKRHGSSHVLDRPLSPLENPGQHLYQRGFPRTVVADQRDNLTRVDIKVDLRQRGNRTETFRDAPQRQDALALRGQSFACLHDTLPQNVEPGPAVGDRARLNTG